jgi:adenylosuccinate synthase
MLAEKIYIVFGLGFGDEGKGTIVDFLMRHVNASTVIRFTGGPQAGHDVITPEGVWHCFAQFGSGLLVPNTLSILSSGMIVDPKLLEKESSILSERIGEDCRKKAMISDNCALVTPVHRMLNQMQELTRGNARHGSCGLGVGLAAKDRGLKQALTVGDVLFNPNVAKDKLRHITELRRAQATKLLERYRTPKLEERFEYFTAQLDPGEILSRYRCILSQFPIDRVDAAVLAAVLAGPVVFESAQGALLHPQYGFRPHVTKTDPTNALTRRFIGDNQATKIGVLRAFAHRHGAGPFPTEKSELQKCLSDPYNPPNDWQGEFRLGWLDLVLIKYGLRLNDGANMLALTNLDRLANFDAIPICTSYRYVGPLTCLDRFFEYERLSRASARIISIKPFSGDEWEAEQRTELLFRCEPYDWIEFAGWSDISTVRKWSDLPQTTRNYIQYLETQLQTPIGIASVGPTAEHKITRQI